MTAGALSALHVEKVAEGGLFGRARWRLLSPLAFASAELGPVEVPAGFETDFASVPRVPLAFWLAGDAAHAAAVLHDYLLNCGCATPRGAAEVMREAMRAEGVPGWRSWAMYWAVRLFGPQGL